MKKKFIQQQKQSLKKLKKELRENLGDFATKEGTEVEGDYKARFPQYGRHPGEESQETTDYDERLDLEHKLELDLLKVNKALEKIKSGKYGKCETCGEAISKKRLKIYPEAEICEKCIKQQR